MGRKQGLAELVAVLRPPLVSDRETSVNYPVIATARRV